MTLFFLARTCRLTRRNCSVFVSVCACASVCQKFESVCRLLTSSSGLKFLYSTEQVPVLCIPRGYSGHTQYVSEDAH